MKVNRILLIVAVFFVLVPGSAQEVSNENIVGVFEGEVYSNSALRFTFKVPVKWFVPSKEQLDKYVSSGRAEFRTGDPRLDQRVGGDKIEFAISKKKVDSRENAVIGYSLMKQPRGVTATMVAAATKDYFLKVPTFKLNKDISKETLGNREFVTFEMGFDNGIKQRVRTYMTMVDDYVITFVLTFWEDEDFRIMLDSLNSIRFSQK